MYVPPRGGVRGGRDLFSWSDVKADKHRENYLGHSVMAPVGRWQNNRDLLWYAKGKDGQTLSEQEIRALELRKVKEAEDEAMLIALGLKAAPRGDEAEQAQEEVKRIMHTRQEEAAEEENVDMVGGVGYGKRATAMNMTSLLSTTRLPGSDNVSQLPHGSLAASADQQERALHRIASLASSSSQQQKPQLTSLDKKKKKKEKEKEKRRDRSRDNHKQPKHDNSPSTRDQKSYSRSDSVERYRESRSYESHRDDRDRPQQREGREYYQTRDEQERYHHRVRSHSRQRYNGNHDYRSHDRNDRSSNSDRNRRNSRW